MFEKLKLRKEKIKKYNKEKSNDLSQIIFKDSFNGIKPIGYIENVPILKNNYIVNSSGILFAMLIRTWKDEYYIIVDSLFDELSNDTKQFILKHELAHKQLKHLENTNKTNGIINNIHNEIEADKFASKYYGYNTAINALDELTKVAKTILTGVQFHYCKRILKKRKKYLNKYYH